MNIIILGPQGSGKGTQAEKAAERFGLLHLSTGELIRQIAKTRPDIDELVNKQGKLLPDDQTLELVANYLEGEKRFDDIIFDGFPRTVNQYGLLRKWLAGKGAKIDLGILLDISEKETLRRLSGRRKDITTGKIYNLITEPPGPSVDPKNLVQRKDDKKEAIKARLAEYRKYTLPLVKELMKESILVKLDGERPIDVIFEDIASRLEALKR